MIIMCTGQGAFLSRLFGGKQTVVSEGASELEFRRGNQTANGVGSRTRRNRAVPRGRRTPVRRYVNRALVASESEFRRGASNGRWDWLSRRRDRPGRAADGR